MYNVNFQKVELFAKECLDAHNEVRRKHGVAHLKLSIVLCQIAQEWAEHIASIGKLFSSNYPHLGENLYQAILAFPETPKGKRIKGSDPIVAWCKENVYHKFYYEPDDPRRTKHFTQIIWKDTEELGIGKASRDNEVYVVAFYSPPGNFIGGYYDNVSPEGGFPDPKPDRPLGQWPMINPNTFAEKGLEAHNELRSLHGVPPLTLNRKLVEFAQEWACELAKDDKFCHRKINPYGENLLVRWCKGSKMGNIARKACLKWYSQIADHVFEFEPKYINWTAWSFTQLVWCNVKELGMAVARSATGKYYIVANYNPRGNYIGKFLDNVFPPIEEQTEIHKQAIKKNQFKFYDYANLL